MSVTVHLDEEPHPMREGEMRQVVKIDIGGGAGHPVVTLSMLGALSLHKQLGEKLAEWSRKYDQQ